MATNEETTEPTADDSLKTTGAPVEEPKATSSKKGKKGEETVEVPASLLQELLDRDKARDDQIARLTEAADLGRLDKYDQEHKGDLIRTAKIGLINHKGKTKMVLGWKSLEDYVGYDSDKGKVEYRQTAEYWLDEGEDKKPTKVVMDQLIFSRTLSRVVGDIVGEAQKDGEVTRTLRFPDGREIVIDIRFLNP